MKLKNLFFFILLGFVLTNCKDNDDENPVVEEQVITPSALKGVWHPKTYQVFFTKNNQPAIDLSEYDPCRKMDSKEFNDNSTVTDRKYGDAYPNCVFLSESNYKYEYNGMDQLRFTSGSQAVLDYKIISLNKDKMVLRFDFMSDQTGTFEHVYQITTYTR